MTSQNRMNAGAEYVLYRIWATLQTERGIHAESLLTCVGALAGYACQQYVRETAPLSRPSDLTAQLVDSPISLWALVSRAVLKLEQPLPDLQEIIRRTSLASDGQARDAGGVVDAGSVGDVPRLPEWHRPDQPAIVYLKQLWPQTLPIAQRFCKRPLQLPVLFGIALQRAIEHTKDLLSPTMAASIAMECAIAMSRVELPEATRATAASALVDAPKASSSTTALALPQMTARAPAMFGKPASTPRVAAPPVAASGRATRSQRKVMGNEIESGVTRAWALMKRIPPAARIATIGCLAFISTAGAMYKTTAAEPAMVASVQTLASSAPAAEPALAMATPQGEAPEGTPEASSGADISGESQFPSDISPAVTQVPPPSQLLADSSSMEAPTAAQILPPGYDEGVMRDEYGQTLQ